MLGTDSQQKLSKEDEWALLAQTHLVTAFPRHLVARELYGTRAIVREG